MPLKPAGSGVTVFFAKQDAEGNFTFMGDQSSDEKQEDTFCVLRGQWRLTPFISWEFKPKKVQIDWDYKIPEIMHQRCHLFGTTLDACVHNFMLHMHKHANQTISLGLHDTVSVGAPVVVADNYPTLLCDNTLATPHWSWYRSCIGDKSVFSFSIRDAYIVHSDKQVLESTVLPLVISQSHANFAGRQLIVVDKMPNPDDVRRANESGHEVDVRRANGGEQIDQAKLNNTSHNGTVIYIHALSQLQVGLPRMISFHPVIRRRDLKAEHVRVYILASVVSDLIKVLCSKLSVEPGQAIEDVNHGTVTHKCIRHNLRLCTILSDLPWDCVVTCCDSTVKLPPGHKIGFWWTLCTMSDVISEDAPLSRVTANKCKFVNATIKRLNRCRMIDLSCILTSNGLPNSLSLTK